MVNTTDIRKICKTNDETEANRLLDEGWKIISIVQVGFGFQYLLVKE